MDEVGGSSSLRQNHFGEDSAYPPLRLRRWSWSRGLRCGAITAVRSPLPHSHGPRISGSRCGQIASRGAYSPILLKYMCTFSILGCCRMGVVEYAVLLGLSVPLATRNLEDPVTAEALQSFLSRMVQRGGAYRWSCENLNGGLGWVSP